MVRKIPPGIFAACTILIFISLALSGCGDKGSNSSSLLTQDAAEEEAAEPVEKTATASFTAEEGGSLSVENDNGIKATLSMTANTLPEDTDISLSITVADDEITIKSTPDALRLYNTAYLTVDFGEYAQSYEEFRLFNGKDSNSLRPLKQKMTSASVTGSLYFLGTFCAIAPDDSLILEISDNEKSADKTSEWQEMLTTFNALLWAGAYYAASGDPQEANDCINAAIDHCLSGTKAFLDKSSLENNKENINSLEKMNYIMGLCNNPEDIQDEISLRFEEING